MVDTKADTAVTARDACTINACLDLQFIKQIEANLKNLN